MVAVRKGARMPYRKRLKGRASEVYYFVCEYARDNSGVTPTVQIIADNLNMNNFQQAATILLVLSDMGLIERVSRYQYKVIGSYWEPPDNVVL